MNYFEELERAKRQVVRMLEERGITAERLRFGGAGDAPERPLTIPTDARSEFLANRAMGDWAEKVLAAGINQTVPEWRAISYGNADKMAAGDPGFKEHYLAIAEEVRLYGKRADLLIFPRSGDVPENMSLMKHAEADRFAPAAIAAIEVRSSKFKAIQYMQLRARQRDAGNRSGREAPSFTVKVEDLKIVYRWIERYQKPQAYVQVFFDSAFGINFLTIFERIAQGEFKIEKHAKNQLKSTIMIPITQGGQVGMFRSPPTFATEIKESSLGRVDAYVRPVGGDLKLDREELVKITLAM